MSASVCVCSSVFVLMFHFRLFNDCTIDHNNIILLVILSTTVSVGNIRLTKPNNKTKLRIQLECKWSSIWMWPGKIRFCLFDSHNCQIRKTTRSRIFAKKANRLKMILFASFNHKHCQTTNSINEIAAKCFIFLSSPIVT